MAVQKSRGVIIPTAQEVVTKGQAVVFTITLIVFVIALNGFAFVQEAVLHLGNGVENFVLMFLQDALNAIVFAITILFLMNVVHKVIAYILSFDYKSIRSENITVDDDLLSLARQAIADGKRRKFFFLVTLHKEEKHQIIDNLCQSIHALDYPKEDMHVFFVIPNKDTVSKETLLAVWKIEYDEYMTILKIPPLKKGEVQTKPRDLNYALARIRDDEGDGMVCVFDAEDQPHPNQALAVLGASIKYPEVAAFQCELRFSDCVKKERRFSDFIKNISTTLAGVSYAAYFNRVLRGYVNMDVTMPFGGTSNYFTISKMRRFGWDGHNITEDFNLSVLFEMFHLPAVMLYGVETKEKPNDAFLFTGVAKQWTRWQAGFLITLLVHMRHPRQLWDNLGPLGFFHILMLGLTPVFGALIPLQLLITFFSLTHFPVISHAMRSAMPLPVLTIAWFNVIVGNLLFVMTYVEGGKVLKLNFFRTLVVILAMYPFAIEVGIRGVNRALFKPKYWGKTAH